MINRCQLIYPATIKATAAPVLKYSLPLDLNLPSFLFTQRCSALVFHTLNTVIRAKLGWNEGSLTWLRGALYSCIAVISRESLNPHGDNCADSCPH